MVSDLPVLVGACCVLHNIYVRFMARTLMKTGYKSSTPTVLTQCRVSSAESAVESAGRQ